MSLPPLGLQGSMRSLTGHVRICFLGINRGFSRGGNILSAFTFHNFLAKLNFPCRVTMHGEENSALLQAAFVSLCFEFRDPHTDQRPGKSANCSGLSDDGMLTILVSCSH
jgi:hypothetical protein